MKISIFHTNDIHSQVSNLAKVGYIINKERESNNNCLLVDSGDMITGDFQFELNKGEIEKFYNNYIKYDVVTIGNHDFDNGLEFLKDYMNGIDAPYVISTIEDKEGLIGNYHKSYIKEVDGLKVGFLGFTLPYLKRILINYPSFKIAEEEMYQKLIDDLKPNCDIIVALSHMGLERDIDLANNTTGIDAIVSAHTHTRLEEGKLVNGVLIVQTGCFNTDLGRIDLEIDNQQMISKTAKLIPLANYLQVDSQLQTVINMKKEESDLVGSKVYGSTASYLDGRREVCIKQSTNLGSLICDSYLSFAKTRGYDPDFAFINARGIRQSIEAGEITYKDIYNTLPFGKQLLVFNILGKDLKAEKSYYIEMQTSNLKIIRDKSGKEHYYNRTIDNPIIDDKLYQAISIDYLYDHELFENLRRGTLLERDMELDIEVVGSYINKLGPNFEYFTNGMVETVEEKV